MPVNFKVLAPMTFKNQISISSIFFITPIPSTSDKTWKVELASNVS